MIDSASVLIIGDHASEAPVKTLLENSGYSVKTTKPADFELTTCPHSDLIILHVIEENNAIFSISQQLKENSITASIPLIFISEITDVKHKIQAFQTGALDFISKPYHSEEVLARVHTQLQLLETRRKLEKSRKTMEQWTATLEKQVSDRTRDILRNERKMRFLAMHDPLTQLPNLNAIKEKLEIITATTVPLAIISLIIEDMDEISSSLGNHTADNVIQQIASRIQESAEDWQQAGITETSIFHVKEDEFIILLENVDSEAIVLQAGESLLARMLEPFSADETILYVPARAGFTLFPEDGKDQETLLRNAQMAANDARKKIRAIHRLERFTSHMEHAARERLERIHSLRQAAKNDLLFLHYQPKVDARDQSIIGMEALVRWQIDENTMIPPSTFIPLAEETGIIFEIGELVVRKACKQIQEWQSQGYEPPPVAVNISPIQLLQYEFPAIFLRTLESYNISTDRITVEITETAFLYERKITAQALAELQRAGIKIHLDDFGSGYSSFSYLSDLPLNCLKIDRSFIMHCEPEGEMENENAEASMKSSRGVDHKTILKGIITLAQGLHLDTIAEGIETPEQADILQQLGCNNMQGYYYFRPMPAEEVIKHLLPPKAGCPARQLQ